MTIEAYLNRISFEGPIDPVPETLRRLHVAHMYAVPFENLDIPLKVPIVLEIPRLFEKVVNGNRGGFCYELNGVFGWLLNEIGFEVDMFAARVFGADGRPGPEFDHMLLRVAGEWIADVGFGDSFTEPMRFDLAEQRQRTGAYRFVESGERWELQQNSGEGWKPQYDFLPVARELSEYEPMCDYHQTSPESIFTQKKVCSKATEKGRVTYANGRLIVTNDDVKNERPIEDEEELASVLDVEFGVVLDGDLAKLL